MRTRTAQLGSPKNSMDPYPEIYKVVCGGCIKMNLFGHCENFCIVLDKSWFGMVQGQYATYETAAACEYILGVGDKALLFQDRMMMTAITDIMATTNRTLIRANHFDSTLLATNTIFCLNMGTQMGRTIIWTRATVLYLFTYTITTNCS